MEPAILHPPMSCSCKEKDMEHLDKILSKAKFHTLQLNEHFPHVILNGPLSLGGMGLNASQTKTTLTGIN
jgi:hypothetical protein